MKFAKPILFGLLIFLTTSAAGQSRKDITVVFEPVFGEAPIQLDEIYYYLSSGDSVQFTNLKFYISDVELTDEKGRKWSEVNSYHLIDVSIDSTLEINFKDLPDYKFTMLKFNIGIDSANNVSGAMGGQLDPTLGMYWTWQSGYINFKLEGKSNLCRTRKNEFTFHLGGYQLQENALQRIRLIGQMSDVIEIKMDIRKFLEEIGIANLNHIMSPGKEAVELSKKLATVISLVKK